MAWKKLVLWAVWGLAVGSWVVAGFIYIGGPTTEVWTAAVVACAVLTEVAFWGTAAVLGTSMWESRKKVFTFLSSPFRQQPNG